MNAKKGLYNVSASLIYKVLTCIIGLIIPRIFVMSYGSELNGLQSSVTQIFGYIALIEAGVGASALQSMFAPAAKKDRDGTNAILGAVGKYYNKIGVIYLFILLGLSFIYPLLVEVNAVSFFTVVLYILFAGASTGINFFFQSKLLLVMQAEGDEYINSFMLLAVYVFSSAVKIMCILMGFNIIYIQLGHFIVNMCATLAYYIIAKKKYPWINFRAKPNMEAIGQKNSVMVHKISGLIFHNVDILLLTFICSLEVVSIYTMYKLVINMVTTVIASFADGINFIFGQSFNNGSRERYCKIIDTFNVFYSALSFGLFTVAYILILPFLKLYTEGMDINYIFEWLPILYIAIEILQIGREAMLRTINVAGKFKDTIYSAMIELSLNVGFTLGGILVCKLVWGDTAGLYGALIGTVVALLYRTIDINYFANKKILNRSTWKSTKSILINAVLFGGIAVAFYFIKLDITNYGWFILAGVVITAVIVPLFVFVQAIFSPSETKFAISCIKSRLKKKKQSSVSAEE